MGLKKRGLLYRLGTYAPRPGRTHKENYFTEVLAGVFERVPELALAVVSKLLDVNSQLSANWILSINTQESFPGEHGRPRPDFVIRVCNNDNDSTERHLIFIESKIDAVASNAQLHKYASVLGTLSENQKKYLVYITLGSEKIELPNIRNIKCKRIYWGNIYSWIKNWRMHEGDEENTLVEELLNLMEDFHMNLDLSISELASAVDYARNGYRKLQWIIDSSWIESEIVNELLAPNTKTSYVNTSEGLYVISRASSNDGYQVNYGFLLNPDNTGNWQIEFPNELLPLAFVSVYKSDEFDVFRNSYGVPIMKLCKEYDWEFGDERCIVRKLFRNIDYNQRELGNVYKKFFVDSMNEIVDAFRRS